MWYKDKIDIETLNQGSTGLVAHLGIEFTEMNEQGLLAKMPVDERTVQPFGLLHGGATAALAETLGSVASLLVIGDGGQVPVGMEVIAQHIRSARSGFVYGKCIPINLGRKVHIWDIQVTDDLDKLIAVCKLTTMIIDKK
jgi:1,4-dihydroxy-2-naphthoyl-CoA hydrolase